MKNPFIFSCVVLLCSCRQSHNSSGQKDSMLNNATLVPATDSCMGLDATVYQYKDEENAPDSMAFTLLFHCKAGRLNGLIFGPYPAGDEGLYFFKDDLDSIRVDSGYMSFSFVQHTYYEKPFTLKNYDTPFSNNILGRGSALFQFRGKMENGTITFICNAEFGPCYADTMVFRKK